MNGKIGVKLVQLADRYAIYKKKIKIHLVMLNQSIKKKDFGNVLK
jgi:hypothetical protein